MMVVALDNIFIQGCKLFANIPQFKRNGIYHKQDFEPGKNMKYVFNKIN